MAEILSLDFFNISFSRFALFLDIAKHKSRAKLNNFGSIGSSKCTLVDRFMLLGSSISCVSIVSELEKSSKVRQFCDSDKTPENCSKILNLTSL